MNNLNSIILEGNLARDPSLAEPVPGFKKCIFSLGVNRFYKNRKNESVDEVSFFDIETWGKLAERVSHQCKKGRGVRVVGRLKQNRWEGSDGKQNSKVRIVAEHVEFKPEPKPLEAAAASATPLPGSAPAKQEEISVF